MQPFSAPCTIISISSPCDVKTNQDRLPMCVCVCVFLTPLSQQSACERDSHNLSWWNPVMGERSPPRDAGIIMPPSSCNPSIHTQIGQLVLISVE